MNGRLQFWRAALREWRGARRQALVRAEGARMRRRMADLYPA